MVGTGRDPWIPSWLRDERFGSPTQSGPLAAVARLCLPEGILVGGGLLVDLFFFVTRAIGGRRGRGATESFLYPHTLYLANNPRFFLCFSELLAVVSSVWCGEWVAAVASFSPLGWGVGCLVILQGVWPGSRSGWKDPDNSWDLWYGGSWLGLR